MQAAHDKAMTARQTGASGAKWAVGALLLLGSVAAHAVTITMSCGTTGDGYEQCKRDTQVWAKKTGNTVQYLSMPQSSTEQLSLYRRMFAARSSGADVLQVDVVWPGMIKDHLIDLSPYTKGADKQMFPATIRNNTVDGKLLAMPAFIDSGMLYYRKDLLEKYKLAVPKTWSDLTRDAQVIQDGERKSGRKDFWGYVFQGKAYEGLTCDALEWVHSYGGGTVVDAKGDITINNPKAAAALDMAAGWVGKIAPPGVLNYAEEDARGLFQSGNAAFMRNWSYAWALGQGKDSPIRGLIGVAPLPAGPDGPSTSSQGGWQLGVSRYSKHPAEAADLVMFMTSQALQKQAAINGATTPTYPDLYKDKDVLAAQPFMGEMYNVFINTTPRPSSVTGLKYNEVSQIFWNGVSDVLSGRTTGTQAVQAIEVKLRQVKRRGW